MRKITWKLGQAALAIGLFLGVASLGTTHADDVRLVECQADTQSGHGNAGCNNGRGGCFDPTMGMRNGGRGNGQARGVYGNGAFAGGAYGASGRNGNCPTGDCYGNAAGHGVGNGSGYGRGGHGAYGNGMNGRYGNAGAMGYGAGNGSAYGNASGYANGGAGNGDCNQCNHNGCRSGRCLFGGCYKPVEGYYNDPRDSEVYSAVGYGVPVTVPLPPAVRYQYQYGWGLPSTRLTRVGNTYTQYYPQQQFTQTGGRLPAGPPMIYHPTDTTQSGFYSVYAPRWQPVRSMNSIQSRTGW